MDLLRDSFTKVSDGLTLALISQAQEALSGLNCRVDTDAFRAPDSLVRFGVSVPVIHDGQKCTLKAIKPGFEEINEPVALRMWNGRGAPLIFGTLYNDFDGEQLENVHLVERTRKPLLNDMILKHGLDEDAIRIMTHVLVDIHSAPDAASIKHLIRDNTKREHDIGNALADNIVPESLVRKFERVAELERKHIAETLHTHTVVHGRPGPGNIVSLESSPSEYVATSSDALWAPMASDYTFMFFNPPCEGFHTPELLTKWAKIAEAESGRPAQETLDATVIQSARAICWSGVLNGEEPEAAKYASVNHYLNVMQAAAHAGGFDLT